MTAQPTAPGDGPASADFLLVATRCAMLSTDDAARLGRESAERGLSPAQLALELGLMDPVQVEIVETLLRPDDQVPGYQIVDVLGRGAMGIVYRARQKSLDRVVALKTVSVGQTTQPGMLARFEKEAITAAQLRHPNIVAAYDFGRFQGRLYFAMELVEGEELGKLIERRGKLSEATTWGLARQVAAGLAHAAKAGVVHRDIKPANLLLVAPPEGFPLPPGMPMVKVTDFGLALLARDAEAGDRLTVAGSTLGTPRYMAPEQLEGSDVDERADIYALGATVYHMLCGQAPFNERTLQAVITRKLQGEAPRVTDKVSSISPAGADLVAEMMTRDPAKRVQDYAILLRRIDRVLAGIPTEREALLETRALPTVDALGSTEIVPAAGTVPSLRGSTQRPAWLKPAIAAGAAVVLLGLAAVAANRWSGGTMSVSPRAIYVPGEWSEFLFDGRSLRGWNINNGAWLPDVDDEGGSILSGRGSATRPLRRNPTLIDYRVTLAVAPRQATAVELQFSPVRSPPGAADRYALRLEGNQIVVGSRSGDGAELLPLAAPVKLAANPDPDATAYHEMRVERHGTHWRAFCDGQQVAVLPLLGNNEVQEIRLVADGGTAWFDAIQVTEMAPPPAAP